jgi:hypothetical protein
MILHSGFDLYRFDNAKAKVSNTILIPCAMSSLRYRCGDADPEARVKLSFEVGRLLSLPGQDAIADQLAALYIPVLAKTSNMVSDI